MGSGDRGPSAEALGYDQVISECGARPSRLCGGWASRLPIRRKQATTGETPVGRTARMAVLRSMPLLSFLAGLWVAGGIRDPSPESVRGWAIGQGMAGISDPGYRLAFPSWSLGTRMKIRKKGKTLPQSGTQCRALNVEWEGAFTEGWTGLTGWKNSVFRTNPVNPVNPVKLLRALRREQEQD